MSIRGRVAIVGVGETAYYKHGRARESEFALALRAILSACEDAGSDPGKVDGFASYSNDRNDPSRLAAALGLPELRFSNMQWGGGGGGGSAAVGNAAAAVATGYADCVVGVRALAQGQVQRFGAAPPGGTAAGGELCPARPPTCWASRRARSTATPRAGTTRRPTPPRASPRWPRTSGRWRASAPRTCTWSRATRTSPAGC